MRQNIEWSPRVLALQAAPGRQAVAKVTVVGPAEFSLQSAYCVPDEGDVRMVENAVTESGVRIALELRTNAGLSAGVHEMRLVIEPRGEGLTPFAVPVRLVVADLVRAAPRRVLDLKRAPGSFVAEVVVASTDASDFEITSAEVADVPLEITTTQRLGVGRWRVVVGGQLNAGLYRGRLSLSLSCPLQPALDVPITLGVAWAGASPD